MDNMEYIDDYFNNSPTDEQKQQFEQQIINDSSFADDVAFYISANGALREQMQQEKKQKFREIYEQQKEVVPAKILPFKKIVRYMAAASVVAAVILSVSVLSGNKTSPQQLADQYTQKNWQILNATMGAQDSLQSAINLYHKGKLTESLAELETILKNDSTNVAAKKNAGIVSFQLKQYDKALAYFSQLASNTALYSNYGKLYEAITLMKRNKTGDEDVAKKLLHEVINDSNQEGKEDAQEWLNKMK